MLTVAGLRMSPDGVSRLVARRQPIIAFILNWTLSGANGAGHVASPLRLLRRAVTGFGGHDALTRFLSASACPGVFSSKSRRSSLASSIRPAACRVVRIIEVNASFAKAVRR